MREYSSKLDVISPVQAQNLEKSLLESFKSLLAVRLNNNPKSSLDAQIFYVYLNYQSKVINKRLFLISNGVSRSQHAEFNYYGIKFDLSKDSDLKKVVGDFLGNEITTVSSRITHDLYPFYFNADGKSADMTTPINTLSVTVEGGVKQNINVLKEVSVSFY